MKIPFLCTLNLWETAVSADESQRARVRRIETVESQLARSWLREVMRPSDPEELTEVPRFVGSLSNYSAR